MVECNNCKHEFEGKYCNVCGEKILEEKDFALKNVMGQAVSYFTNIDSKLFKTFKLLFFKPGKLSLKFVEGIRVPYMKPFQLFIISNIIFFILLGDFDLFRTPSKWFFQENFDGIRVMDQVRHISASRGVPVPDIAHLYDLRSSNLAKGLIVLLIPLIGLVGFILNFNRKFQIGKHIIFATHYFSFVLLIFVLITVSSKIVDFGYNRLYFLISITSLTTLYYVIGMRVFYKNGWGWSILKGISGIILINVFIQLYRVMINLISLNTI